MAIEDEYESHFAEMTDQARTRVAEALRQEAEALVAAQKNALRALLQPPEESGNLEESLTVLEGDDDMRVIVQAGGKLTAVSVRSGTGAPSFDYAEAFEFGTRHQPARPFFFPTYRERREEIQANVQKAAGE